MKESCRLCLAEDTDQDFAVFSNMLTSSLSVYEAYKIFTLICLAPEDQRNSKICLECLQKLHSTFDFRTQVIENNECLTYKIEIVTLNSVKVENSPISDEESDDFDHRATSPSNSYFEAEDKPEKLKDHIPVYNDSGELNKFSSIFSYLQSFYDILRILLG